VVPRYGLFPRYCTLQKKIVVEIQQVAIWTCHVIRTYEDNFQESTQWVRDHWTLAGPTAIIAMPGMQDMQGIWSQELLHAPARIHRYEYFLQNGKVSAINIREAALSIPKTPTACVRVIVPDPYRTESVRTDRIRTVRIGTYRSAPVPYGSARGAVHGRPPPRAPAGVVPPPSESGPRRIRTPAPAGPLPGSPSRPGQTCSVPGLGLSAPSSS
jgi:hypothetical protein